MGESTLSGIFWTNFFCTFCIILGVDFLISFNVLRNTKNGFLTQILQHIYCYLSNDNDFSKKILCIHTCLFEWKTSFRCGIFHIEFKWDNKLICNIWLSTSSNLFIIWMIHFAIYQYNFFFNNIFFNHLISTSKWDFFFLVLKYISPSIVYKN
jgi:hypothetical protein